jgi:hypothetical protein
MPMNVLKKSVIRAAQASFLAADEKTHLVESLTQELDL